MKKQSSAATASKSDNVKKLIQRQEKELNKARRQLEIEAALERVRSLTMVMKHSGELSEIILTVYKELRQLDMALTRTLIWLFSENPDMFEVWVADTEADKTSFVMKQEVEHPYHKRMFEKWKERKSKWVYINEGEGKKDLDDYLFTKTAAVSVPEEVKAGIRAVDRIVNTFSFHNFGGIQADGAEEISDEKFEILYRFAKEFDLAYARFLDLQKAEAQAREAQIEAALERVRSRSIAMRRSGEIADIAAKIFDELRQLDLALNRVLILTFNDAEKYTNWWSANPEVESTAESYRIDYNENPVFINYLQAWQQRKPIYLFTLSGDTKKSWEDHLFEHTEMSRLPMEVRKGMRAEGTLYTVSVISDYGLMMSGSFEPLSEANIDIIQRFGRVFQQSYTRYLDVQKAEAQAREAEIQLALERVRARTMAMHKSDELSDTASIMFQELKKLGINSIRTGVCIFDFDQDTAELWLATEDGDKTETKVLGKVSGDMHAMYRQWIEAGAKKKKLFQYKISGKELSNYYDIASAHLNLPKQTLHNKSEIYYGFFFSGGSINVITTDPLTEEELDIGSRFANVFGLLYRRFLDLQKAETQAREAQIEAGLERVRAQAMAMHRTDDLVLSIEMFYEQMSILLDIPIVRCGAGLLNKKNSICELASTSKNDNGKTFSVKGNIDMNGHPLLKNTYNHWLEQKEYYHVLSGSEIKKYYQYMTNQVAIPDFTDDEEQHFYFPMFSEGSFYVITKRELLEDELRVFRRFSSVLSLTYRRFNDLKRAEKQAREAEIEAALERIRSSSLGMQKSDELQKIVTVVIKELLELGVALDAGGGVIICTYIKDSKDFLQWMASPDFSHSGSYLLPYFDHPIMNDSWKFKESGVDFSSKSYSEEEKNSFFKHSFEHSDHKYFHDDLKKWILQTKKYVLSWAWSKNSAILIPSHTGIVPSESEKEILIRFSRVFDQAYTRFLDLQKAEAQAREAQIEAAVEKVRSRTIGMQHSDELQDAAMLLFQQVEALGVPVFGCGFNIWDNDRKEATAWMAGKDRLQPPFKTSSSEDIFLRINEAARRGVSLFVEEQGGEALNTHYEYMNSIPIFKEIADKMAKAGQTFPTFQIMHCAFFSQGYLMFITFEPVPESYDIFRRFAKIFEQTYTRFLDLQKAEKQAREAQIEAALEKVRSRTMGMRHSSELIEASDLLFQQVRDLGVPAFSCSYNIFERGEKECTAWMSDPNGGGLNPVYHIRLTEDANFIRFYDSKEKGEEFYVLEMGGERMQEHYRYLRRIDPEFDKAFSQLEEKGLAPPEKQIHHLVNFDHGNVMFITLEPVPEAHDIFRRFGKVFEQTYRRFLDLKKAEAQAREAQIESALERVRSKTMAMHNSVDVGDTVVTMFDELVKLGIQSNRCGIVIFNESKFSEIWTAKSSTKDQGSLVIGHLDVSIHPLLENVRLAWERKDSFFSYEMEGEYLRGYYQAINSYKEYPTSFNMGQLPERETLSDFFFSEGAIFAFTNEPLKTEATLIFKRFAGVFGQTYRRYLDLKKAESQAREARIEAALERIRAAAMAMHSSEDVSDATSVMFSQLDELGVETIRCGVALFNTETKSMEAWASAKSSNKRVLQITGKIDMTIHPLLESLYDAWKSKKQVHRYDLRGDNLKSYYEAITEKSGFNLPFDNLPSKQTANSFFFPEGSLYAFTEKPLEGENAEIFKRFTKVFTLTYRRYLDLIEAEVRTRDAIKQSSLDRVRGEIASMRTAKDLERITPLIWQELVSLDVPFIRCGVFIMNQDKRIIDNYLSTPDGKAIAAFHLPYDTPGFVTNVLQHWKDKEIYIEHWNASAMADFANVLVQQNIFSSPDQYLQTLPKEGFYLHLLPFLQGMLYVGNLTQLDNNQVDVLQSVANTFSSAYARYDDFNRLEMAKNQVDRTLVELKQAQQQLIHSEKMASLGELTAGIAHEIQNPLNFVNNFSEVNKELIAELEEAILHGDYEAVKAITEDLAGNQEKINHHGKRAEGIVKGMLQHSRSSTGQKELTNLNALCDEYLRLAYHGFRAKDKSFNAEYKLNLDPLLPQVNVVPQDIGRVLLNLINNAFQAVSGKAKNILQSPEEEVYTPKVTVSTKTIPLLGGDKGGLREVKITIKDNGPGIPDEIKEKIFQPFFTTKPAGQGTGLGLSLSYDIVKAHGGELKVDTQFGSYTEFTMLLPQ